MSMHPKQKLNLLSLVRTRARLRAASLPGGILTARRATGGLVYRYGSVRTPTTHRLFHTLVPRLGAASKDEASPNQEKSQLAANIKIENVRWYYATDLPLKQFGVTSKASKKTPEKFKSFSDRDSALLEEAYQASLKSNAGADTAKVSVLEDQLFEVDVQARTLLPVYWEGPVFEVRRGTWFEGEGDKQMPLPESLANELETFYNKSFSEQSQERAKQAEEEEEKFVLKTRLDEDNVIRSVETKSDTDGKKKETVRYVSFKNRTAAIFEDGLASTFLRKLGSIGVIKVTRGYERKVENSVSAADAAREETQSTMSRSADHSKHVVSETQKPAEADREIDHLVLCIHGIGQKLSHKIDSVNFVHDINVFRKLLTEVYVQDGDLKTKSREYQADKLAGNGGKLGREQLKEKLDAEQGTADKSKNHRVQVLPLVWRHSIEFGSTREENKLPDDRVTLEDITIDGVVPLRSLIADVALDVLLYYQPQYHKQIISTTVDRLNKLYHKFCEHNPKFAENPRVSIIGHSLGSCIGFDIVCEQGKRCKDKEYFQLDFPVEMFTGLGSPVGMFQLLKGNRIVPRAVDDEGQDRDEEPNTLSPNVKSYYNVFHPTDPVAYRVDPLVHRDAASLAPGQVEFANGTVPRQLKAFQELSGKVFGEATEFWDTASKFFPFGSKAAAMIDQVGSKKASQTEQTDNENQGKDAADKKKADDEASTKDRYPFDKLPKETQDAVKRALRQINPTGQIDHALQVGPLELTVLTALASHISYFESADVADFTLRAIYRSERQPEPEE